MTSTQPSPDAVQNVLSEIELLRAMYPSEGELVFDESTEAILLTLSQWSEDGSTPLPNLPGSITFLLNLDIDEPSSSRRIPLHISCRLRHELESSEFRSLTLRVGRPGWLTRAEAAQLNEGLPDEDILSAIEHVRDRAISLLTTKSQVSDSTEIADTVTIERVWFYFPSISTREKRNELVRIGPSYGLTGFLLAGKPGILCVEGGAQKIDDYMRYIKTVSWADIMPGHKKVSERYREAGGDVKRIFPDMQEITNLLEKRGERSNRGDMKALEAWLTERGLAEAFSKVLL